MQNPAMGYGPGQRIDLRNFYGHPGAEGLYPKSRILSMINDSPNKRVLNQSSQKDPVTGRKNGLNEFGEPMTLQEQLTAMTSGRMLKEPQRESNGFQSAYRQSSPSKIQH